MQEGANTIHTQNLDVLIIVSGLSYDSNLGFLKSQPLAVNFTNKLVFAAHWYSFAIPADKWAAQITSYVPLSPNGPRCRLDLTLPAAFFASKTLLELELRHFAYVICVPEKFSLLHLKTLFLEGSCTVSVNKLH